MTRDDDDNLGEFDTLLADHFRHRLDAQLGRAATAFEADARATRSPRRLGRFAVATVGLIAASIAVAWAVWPRTVLHPVQPTPATIATVTLPSSPSPRELERLVMWRTFDDGAAVLGKQLPVRKLRQEGFEQVEFYLPDAGATVKVTVPVVRNVMVQMETY